MTPDLLTAAKALLDAIEAEQIPAVATDDSAVDAAITNLRAAVEHAGWRPIETAPQARDLIEGLEHWLSTGGPVTNSDRFCVNALCRQAKEWLAKTEPPLPSAGGAT